MLASKNKLLSAEPLQTQMSRAVAMLMLLFTNCFWLVSNRCWRIWYKVTYHQWSWRIR